MFERAMAHPTTEPTSVLEKVDRCGDLDHRPRVLLGKMGLDGHDRGVKLISRAMRDSGIHVIYSGLWQTPRSLAISARDEDVDCIASSMMSNSHLVLVPNLIEECRKVGRPDMRIHVGGIIPQEDVQTLLDAGVEQVFHTGTSMQDIVDCVRSSTQPFEPVPTDDVSAVLSRNISLLQLGRGVAGRSRVDHPERGGDRERGEKDVVRVGRGDRVEELPGKGIIALHQDLEFGLPTRQVARRRVIAEAQGITSAEGSEEGEAEERRDLHGGSWVGRVVCKAWTNTTQPPPMLTLPVFPLVPQPQTTTSASDLRSKKSNPAIYRP